MTTTQDDAVKAAAHDLLAALIALLEESPYADLGDKCECGAFLEDGACCHVFAREVIAKATCVTHCRAR